MRITIDEKDAGTVSQPVPIIWIVIYFFIYYIGLIGEVMMRAHTDRRPNVIKWYVLTYSTQALTYVGGCSPYPLVSTFGSVFALLFDTVGVYLLVMIDKDAEQSDVQNGCALLAGLR